MEMGVVGGGIVGALTGTGVGSIGVGGHTVGGWIGMDGWEAVGGFAEGG